VEGEFRKGGGSRGWDEVGVEDSGSLLEYNQHTRRGKIWKVKDKVQQRENAPLPPWKANS
jgi:hypothetical protein